MHFFILEKNDWHLELPPPPAVPPLPLPIMLGDNFLRGSTLAPITGGKDSFLCSGPPMEEPHIAPLRHWWLRSVASRKLLLPPLLPLPPPPPLQPASGGERAPPLPSKYEGEGGIRLALSNQSKELKEMNVILYLNALWIIDACVFDITSYTCCQCCLISPETAGRTRWWSRV